MQNFNLHNNWCSTSVIAVSYNDAQPFTGKIEPTKGRLQKF